MYSIYARSARICYTPYMIRYIVFSLVALTLTLFTWLGGGIVAQWLRPWALWLSLLMAEFALLVPEQRHGESLFDARKRVIRGILLDPLTWLSLALCTYLTIQWVNACTFMAWDELSESWKIFSPAFESLRNPAALAYMNTPPAIGDSGFLFWPEPPCAWLPWSLRADEARGVLYWFVPTLVGVIVARHALLNHTKRQLLAFVCIMTSVLAIAGILQFIAGSDFLYWGRKNAAFFFATFGYPNHAACFFPMVMALSIGMLLWTLEHRDVMKCLPARFYAASTVLCAVSGILSGSRAGMLLTLAVTAFSALYIPFRYFTSLPSKLRFAVPALILILGFTVVGTAGFRIYAIQANQAYAEAKALAKTEEELAAVSRLPRYGQVPAVDGVLKEIADTDWEMFIEHPMLMRSGYQGILALRQHADYPLFGSGAWSFRWLNIRYINAEDPEEQKWFENRKGVGQANVHNDTLQYLAEHGWVGFGLMLAIIAALALPFLWVLVRSPAKTVSDVQADRCWLNRLNVACVYIFIATFMAAFHSFIDLIFRSPACMMLYALLFVCAPACVVGTKTTAYTPPSPKPEIPHA